MPPCDGFPHYGDQRGEVRQPLSPRRWLLVLLLLPLCLFGIFWPFLLLPDNVGGIPQARYFLSGAALVMLLPTLVILYRAARNRSGH